MAESANLLLSICNVLQGNDISSDKKVNIVLKTGNDIVLDCWVKTQVGWVDRWIPLGKEEWEGSYV